MFETMFERRSVINKRDSLTFHHTILLIGLALFIAFFVACSSPAAEAGETAVPPTDIPPTTIPPTDVPPTLVATLEPFQSWVIGEITSPAMADNLLGDSNTRSYLVYLPPSYAQGSKHYPVVYALHGGLIHDEYELSHLGHDLDRMIVDGEAPEMILVFPNAQNKFGGNYGSSSTIGDTETYITHDLVNFIDANFRTIPHKDSRGITGCAPGGAAAIRYAFLHPDVFSVAVGISGLYDPQSDILWEQARSRFVGAPSEFAELTGLPWQIQLRIGFAAEAAPNPDKPPFFLDMPFEMVDGTAQIVPEVAAKINATYTTSILESMLDDYLDQPVQLRGVMLYHAKFIEDTLPTAHTDVLSNLLMQAGVDHEVFIDSTSKSCDNSEPVLQFMIENLSFEMPE